MKDNEIKFYKDKACKYRGTPAQVGYGSIQSQHIRFNSIYTELFKYANEYKEVSILDFGCGTGYFYEQLSHSSLGFSYTGIDAIEENIEDAIIKNSNMKNNFICINADENFSYENYDFIVFSGPFSTTEPEIRNTLFSKFLSSAKIGVIGNFIRHNSLIDRYEDGCYMVDPSEIIRVINPAEYKFTIRADYMPHDFMVSAIRWERKL